ncbi:Uncharacterized protein FKW44_022105 [Caligus rogercresseyi]|uniref:Uncharacterized protein n=1 Tax=Caligus rogercresseyi TaxID=217165 RepID=A0A7T8GSE5_CALRO|nr:Uncharacterized protein FKW44_022105 [Caligus rogercresseyi]
MMEDSVTSGGGKGRGGDGGAQDSDLLDDSVLRETENQMLDVLLSGFQRDKVHVVLGIYI